MTDTPIILPSPRIDPYRGPPPHEKGPLVFLDYDQIELDAAYDQAVYQPNILQLNKRWASNSARTRARIGEPERRAYGDSGIEQLDLFRTAKSNAPIFVFIHGGAWIRGDAKSYSAPAEMFVGAGAHYTRCTKPRETCVLKAENSASLGVPPRAGSPRNVSTSHGGSQRHFSLVKVLLCAQSQSR
jgi:hypothetical protein